MPHQPDAAHAAPDASLLHALDQRLRARAQREVAAALDPALVRASDDITAALSGLVGRGITPTVHHTIQADAGERIRAIAVRAVYDALLQSALLSLDPQP